MLGIGPHVCVKPVQMVRRTPANRIARNSLVRIKHRKLRQKLSRFPQSVGLREDGVAADGPCDCANELNDCLMRQADGVFDDAAPQDLRRNLLFTNKPVIEAVGQAFVSMRGATPVQVLYSPTSISSPPGLARGTPVVALHVEWLPPSF